MTPSRRTLRLNTSAPRRAARRSGTAALALGLPFALGGAVLCSAALAEPGPSRPMPAQPAAAVTVPSEPGVTTASYGDWVLRCQRLPGEGTPRLCEVGQSMQVQGQAAPIAQLAIGHLPGQEGLRVTALLPANVGFPSTVRVGEAKAYGREGREGKDAKEPGKGSGPGLDLAWRRCIPGGCLADGAAPEAVLKAWRTTEEPGRITFKDADGRELGVPLSFRGLGSALDALAKEKS